LTTKHLNILVVDDDKDNAHSMAELFELDGHRATTVYSGDGAIGAYIENDYDVAFMDVVMPGKNGVDSFLEIRRLKPRAMVYMMSGYSVEQLMQQALQEGTLGVFSRPMAPASILEVLQEVGDGGIVISEEFAPNAGEIIHHVLREAGVKARVLKEPRSVLLQPPSVDDGMLIYDFHSPLIEGIGVCKEVRSQGNNSPAILVAGARNPRLKEEPLLRDFSVTGIVSKPFDPVQILDYLKTIND
jgi:two-component system, NtrC family, response regulator HydG